MINKFFLCLLVWSFIMVDSLNYVNAKGHDENGVKIDSLSTSIIRNISLTYFPNRHMEVYPSDVNDDAAVYIQHFIDSCSANGGGVVVLTPGIYLCGRAVVLKSNVNLHLKKGALLKFSGKPNDFLPVVKTKWEGTELYNYSPMIYAYCSSNIAITGEGEIDGNAGAEFAKWNLKEREAKLKLRRMGNELIPVYYRVFGKDSYLRPSFIQPFACSKILIEGVTIRNSPFWTIHPVYCDNVVVRNVKIYSDFPNNDGCDPESSSNILIENCSFFTGDDAIAIKAGRDEEARKIGRSARNIVIRNCVFSSKCNGLCIGSEMSGGVENIVMYNIKVSDVKNALYFKSNKDRGGYIRNIYIDNVRVNSVQGAAIRFETNYFGYRGGNFESKYENFYISDIEVEKTNNYAIFMDGNANNKISNVKIENLNVYSAARPFYFKNIANIEIHNSFVNNILLPKYPKESDTIETLKIY